MRAAFLLTLLPRLHHCHRMPTVRPQDLQAPQPGKTHKFSKCRPRQSKVLLTHMDNAQEKPKLALTCPIHQRESFHTRRHSRPNTVAHLSTSRQPSRAHSTIHYKSKGRGPRAVSSDSLTWSPEVGAQLQDGFFPQSLTSSANIPQKPSLAVSG